MITFATEEQLDAVRNIKGDTQLPSTPVYDLDSWMIGWNHADAAKYSERIPGKVCVGPWPDKTGWSREYGSTMGCCFTHWRELTRVEKMHHIVNGFLMLVLAERLDPAAVHREFWKIADYREIGMGFLGMDASVMFTPSGLCNPCNPDRKTKIPPRSEFAAASR
jgi:hypothetical protein